jgi:dCMP deaminase
MTHNSEELRPTWPSIWMAVAKTIALRSYDPRLKVGAIVVSYDNTQMLSIGYNGNYKGGPHEHESKEPGKSGFIHAEVNALVKCDFNFPKKKHLYVTHSPCKDCAKLIINAEIARVVYEIPYRDPAGLNLLRSVGIEVLSLEDAIINSRLAR